MRIACVSASPKPRTIGASRGERLMVDGLRLIDPPSYSKLGYPHAEWKELRRMPLTYFEPEGWQPYWAITKHADVIEVSKQPERFLNGPGMTIIRKREEQ